MGDTLVDSIDLKLKDLNVDPAQLVVGQNYDTVVAVNPTGAQIPDVLYLSTDKRVVTVNQAGNIHVVGAGSAEVIVLTKDGEYTDTLAVTAVAPTLVTAATSSPDASTAAKAIQLIQGDRGTIQVGTGTGTDLAIKLKLTPANANNYSVRFNSDDPSVKVDASTGEFEAMQGGLTTQATITAVVTNLSDGSIFPVRIYFKVAAAVTGFSFNPAALPDLSLGGTKTAHGTINLTPTGAKARSITFHSEDDTIATVAHTAGSLDFDVTGVKVGETDIKVTIDSLADKSIHAKVVV